MNYSRNHVIFLSYKLGCLMLLCLPFLGCRSIPPPAPQKAAATSPSISSPTNQQGTVATYYPSHSRRFTACQKLNPLWWFGNAGEPVPPDWYRPGKRCRNLMWRLRNPCHNFDAYVIGIADKPFTRAGRFPNLTANPNGGWNWAVCRYKRLRLPFIDYERGRFKFYWGWRINGAFGMKLNFAAKKEAKQP